MQFDTDIVKMNFAMTCLTKLAQNWFEIDLNQKDQSIVKLLICWTISA